MVNGEWGMVNGEWIKTALGVFFFGSGALIRRLPGFGFALVHSPFTTHYSRIS
jgi:hypothetical protein